jgi:pimeloyl-ACP methyl ester carboxylesterase
VSDTAILELPEHDVLHAGYRTRALSIAGEGPPIVLIHGFADSADTWRPLMRCLAERGRAAVAVDLPNFGRAERQRSEAPLLDLYQRVAASAVRSAARQWGGEAVLVGSSLGGLAALRAAQDDDLPARAVVAIGPAGFGVQPWVAALQRAAVAIGLAARAPVPHALSRALMGEAYARLCTRGGVDRETRERFCSHLTPGDLGRVLLLGRQVLAEVSQPGAVDVAEIAVPVSLIWGRHDALCPASGAEIVLARRPDVVVHLRDDAGHCVHLDEAEAVAEIVAAL